MFKAQHALHTICPSGSIIYCHVESTIKDGHIGNWRRYPSLLDCKQPWLQRGRITIKITMSQGSKWIQPFSTHFSLAYAIVFLLEWVVFEVAKINPLWWLLPQLPHYKTSKCIFKQALIICGKIKPQLSVSLWAGVEVGWLLHNYIKRNPLLCISTPPHLNPVGVKL